MVPKLPEEPVFLPNSEQSESVKSSEGPGELIGDQVSDKSYGPANLKMSELKELNNIRRKNQILTFGFLFLICLGIFLLVTVGVDVYLSEHNIKSELLMECFNVLRYAITTVMGYIFAKDIG